MISLYKLDLELQRRYFVLEIKTHTDVPLWLKNNGNCEIIYEVWKKTSIHSRWCWKKEKGKWGRMATPKK